VTVSALDLSQLLLLLRPPATDKNGNGDTIAVANDNVPIGLLPLEIQGEVVSYLQEPFKNDRLTRLLPVAACVSRGFYRAATGRCTIEQLLRAVVLGEKAQVEAIIKHHPQLLLERGNAKTYAGKILKGFTALQMALLEGDVQINEGQPEMAEILRDAVTAHHGDDALQQQVTELYQRLGIKSHDELVAKQKASAEETRAKIKELIESIKNCDHDELQAALYCSQQPPSEENKLWKTLNDFRQWFAQRANSEEIAYNPYHMLVAFDAHNDAFSELGDWDRRNLCWRQVVGWVQCYLSASTAQVFTTSLFNIANKVQLLQRQLSSPYHKRCPALPASSSFSGLGFYWALHPRGVPYFVSPFGGLGGTSIGGRALSKIISNKINSVASLLSRATHQNTSEQISSTTQTDLSDSGVTTGVSQLY